MQQRLDRHRGLLLIDGNNVRAATGFRYTACEMSACLDAWAHSSAFADRVVVVWDHGSEAAGFLLPHSAVLMSGPKAAQTADDVIVQLCGYLAGGSDVVVVTSDKALLGRCRTQWMEAGAATSEIQCLHAVCKDVVTQR